MRTALCCAPHARRTRRPQVARLTRACGHRWHEDGKLAVMIHKSAEGLSTAASKDGHLFRAYMRSPEGKAAIRAVREKMRELCGGSAQVRALCACACDVAGLCGAAVRVCACFTWLICTSLVWRGAAWWRCRA